MESKKPHGLSRDERAQPSNSADQQHSMRCIVFRSTPTLLLTFDRNIAQPWSASNLPFLGQSR